MTVTIDKPGSGDHLTDQDWQASNATGPSPDSGTLTAAVVRRRLRFPGGELIIEIVDPPAWVEPTIQSLGKLLQLGPNWDSYGGAPVDPLCVAAALRLIFDTFSDDTPAPSVVPTSGGGLQLEWHTRGVELEVEFLTATCVRGLFEDTVSGLAWEKDLDSYRRPLVDAIATLSQRQ